MSLRYQIAAAVAGVVALATSAYAAPTVINVTESGEAGGLMTLALDQSEIHAGSAVFNVKNNAKSEEHEMVLIRLDSPDKDLAVDGKSHRIDESSLKSLGEVADLKPGASGTLTADLKPGTYMLFCNIEGHYESGMHARLTVMQ